MANPILHIKDGYFFEVPKFLWRYHYQSIDELKHDYPFLVAAHPHATIGEFNRGLSGKIIIPQPFATLKNLHDKESGFAISKFMVLEVVIGALLVFIFSRVAARIASGAPPKGKLWNLFESVLFFVRDEIAAP